MATQVTREVQTLTVGTMGHWKTNNPKMTPRMKNQRHRVIFSCWVIVSTAIIVVLHTRLQSLGMSLVKQVFRINPPPKIHSQPLPAGIEKPSPFVQIPIRKKEICKYHMMGKCRKGTQCALKHPRNDKQRLLELASRNRYDSTSRPFQPANSTSLPSKSIPVSPSTPTWQADIGEDVSDAQATDAEPIDADEDNDNQSKDQDDSNHSEIDEQGARDIDLPASPHNRRRTEDIQTRDVLPDIPRQRVDEPTQPPTVHYPHVSEVSLHWSQFADPLANPEIAFCKFHAQGQCVQGESCSFRHSITVQEYFMLFRDQQPNLCTLSRDRSAQNALHQRVPPLSSSTLSPSYYPALPQVPATLDQPPSSPFSRECNFYRLGTCRNNPCPWLHTDPPAEVENRPGRSEQRERSIPDTPAPTQAKSTPTQPLCRYIGSKRGCTRSDCRFSHGDSFGNSYPSSGPSGPQSSTGPVIEEKDNGWDNDNDNGWNNDSWGKNDAENNGWGESVAGGTPWDNDASALHPKNPKPKPEDEWPHTDESSHSAPWIVAAPAPCSRHPKGKCKEGASCQLRHDVGPRTPDTTASHSRLDYENPQSNLEASKGISDDQNMDTTEEDNQWTGENAATGENDEEHSPKEPQELHAEEMAQELEEQPEPAFECPEVKFIMKCDVRFGPTAIPDQITTATETNKLVISGLPLEVSPGDIETLVKPYGRVQNSISLDETDDSSCIEVEFFDKGEARAAFKNLEGHEYEGRVLRTSLRTLMVAVVRSPTHNLNLKVSWPSPHILAWSHYSTITQAKEAAAQLNGVIIRGRTVGVTFVAPNKNQRTSFAIKLENLPLEVQKSDLEDVCKGSTLITMEKPSYSTDATNAIRTMLYDFGYVEDFDTEPRTNATTTSRAFVMFRNESVAKQVRDLDGQPQDFLGGQALTIRSIYCSRVRISRMLFDAIKTDLDLLKEDSKKCTIQYYDHRDHNFVWVRIYSPTSSHPLFEDLNAALLFFIEGTVLRSDDQEIWDEYFETTSSANALEKIQQKTTTFIHCDDRTKKIRIFGGKTCQEEARKALVKLIAKVRTQRHEIDLRRPMFRPIVDDGCRSLQIDIGINKVSIDVVHAKLIVRGSSEDVEKAHSAISAFAIDSEAVRGGVGGCQICHYAPIDSVRLSCRHAYCKACQHFAIKQPSQVPFCCISERTFPDGYVTRCETPLGYGLIQHYFPSETERLLRVSFLHYIRSGREDLFFCPTLECQAVHRAGDESVNINCSVCVSEVCTFCKSHAHVGLSCAKRKALARM
ncbi:hypothetical protein M413DRAFT_366525 [Hebeloma cylindrosporum]|uniref:Uncharacterized protein n=1 Tax=Hebeloma cylindrosporum TaxID=76867 RepID=A0A0C2YV82_HEBCY|nr:hypothetical protein M413DRAFT_366525 [Hebeloma cylindrosporum h7]